MKPISFFDIEANSICGYNPYPQIFAKCKLPAEEKFYLIVNDYLQKYLYECITQQTVYEITRYLELTLTRLNLNKYTVEMDAIYSWRGNPTKLLCIVKDPFGKDFATISIN